MTEAAGPRLAIVTGGARNIGLAISVRLATDGYRVAVNGDDDSEVRAAVESMRASGLFAEPATADVTDAKATTEMISRLCIAWGPPSILVNNAAVPTIGRVPFLELKADAWDRSFAVNVTGAFHCTQSATREMVAARIGGSIVMISSIGARRAHRRSVAYDATKGALESATRALALDLAPHGVRVNAVAPGRISNDRFEELTPAQQRGAGAAIPLGRAGTPHEVAAAVSFLCSDDASYITGHVLAVDGGLAAQARSPAEE